MANFALAGDLHVHPTPAGAYYAVSAADPDPSRRMLQSLLRMPSSPRLTLEGLMKWADVDDEHRVLTLLYHVQSLGWVQGLSTPQQCDERPLEVQLPNLLKGLVVRGKALLADNQGFYLASHGFPHEVAEELSALSADLSNLHARRSALLANNLGLASSAWAVVDAAGNSKLGFWPLFIGGQRFVMVISGVPQFNHPDLVSLVWILIRRYDVPPA